MNLTLSQLIVWVIVGGLAGTLVGRLITFKKEGLGFWTNLAVGMIGAMMGGAIFSLLRIDLGLGAIRVTFEELAAAVVGSLLFLALWWLARMVAGMRARRAA